MVSPVKPVSDCYLWNLKNKTEKRISRSCCPCVNNYSCITLIKLSISRAFSCKRCCSQHRFPSLSVRQSEPLRDSRWRRPTNAWLGSSAQFFISSRAHLDINKFDLRIIWSQLWDLSNPASMIRKFVTEPQILFPQSRLTLPCWVWRCSQTWPPLVDQLWYPN